MLQGGSLKSEIESVLQEKWIQNNAYSKTLSFKQLNAVNKKKNSGYIDRTKLSHLEMTILESLLISTDFRECMTE